jgi:hypothetical protein
MQSEIKSVAFLRALFGSDVAVALLFFTLALAVRWYFAATHPYFSGLLSVRGVPYVDGQVWTLAAIRLIHGEGLGTVYRPFYSILLALFFIWTDWSFAIITCLNVVIGALSTAFLFLTVRHTFNRWIASSAAMFFAFDPSQIITTPQAGTEPLGLLFFILSLYFMLEIGRRRTASATVLSGIFLGLSNLTRPLTLFCAPVYALVLAAFEWSRRKSLRWAIIVASLFTLGIVASMGPWLIRQKLVHNIWSVSSNMGEALYGATSPKHKTWSMRVRLDAYRAEIPSTIEATYSFYMQKSIEQIRDNPGFYLSQTGRALWIYLNCFDRNYRAKGEEFAPRQAFSSHVEAQTLFIFIVGAMLLLAGLWKVKNDAFAGATFLAVSLVLIALWRILPPYGNFLILSAGFILGLVSAKSRQNVSLLAASLLVTGIGGAIFNNAILYRAVLMTDWLFACFYLAAFFYTASALTSALLRVLHKNKPTTDSPETASRAHPFATIFESRVKQAAKILTILFLLFAGVSATRLILTNARAEQRPKPIAKLNYAQKMEILQRLKKLSSSLDRSLPTPDKVHFYVARPQSQSLKPTVEGLGLEPIVAIESGTLPYFIHHFPEGTHLEGRGSLFKKRPFEYSVFRFPGLDVVFPGRIAREFSGRTAVLVGRIKPPERPLPFIPYTLECEAIIPFADQKNPKLDYAHALLPKTAAAANEPFKVQ